VGFEMVQLLLKILMKQRTVAVHHDFHSLVFATELLKLNFIHVMLKSRCRKILEARSRRRTFYLRLRNPAKERKNSFAIFSVKLKRLKQS